MTDLLPFLPVWPVGSALVVLGLACAAARGRFLAPLGLAAVALEGARLEGSGLPAVGALAILAVVGLGALGSMRAGARDDAGSGPAGMGPGLSLIMAGALLLAVQLEHLGWLAPVLGLACVLERAVVPSRGSAGRDPATGEPTTSAHSWRGAVMISLASVSLVGLGAQGRLQDGGDVAVGWIGTPFAGDTPSTLLFLGLVLPLALPPSWGGAAQALAAGPAQRDGGAFLQAGLLRGIALTVLLGRTFFGADALLNVGLAAAALAPLMALLSRPDASRLLALGVHGGLGVLLCFAAIASSGAAGALAMGVLALAAAGSGSALGLVLATEAREAEPGLGERGLGHVFPTAFAFTLLAVLALMAVPGTLSFEAFSSGLAAMSADGAAVEAVALAALSGSLATFVAAPFLRRVFFSAGAPGGHREGRRARAPRALLLSMALAAGALLALGQAPGLLGALMPEGAAPTDRLLTPAQQLQVLLGAALLAGIVRRERSTPTG